MSSIREKEVINLVMRQTDYTEEQTQEKLKQWNNNYINVIKEYLNPEFNKNEIKQTNKTLNQQMMREIRTFMDDVYIKFENRKKYNQYANIIKQMRENELSKKKEDSNNESEEVVNKIKIEEVE